MKINKIHIVLVLCLAMSGAGSQKIHGQTALKESSDAFEKPIIKAGLDEMGIGEGYDIIVADERGLVENTAAEELQRLLAKASLSVGIVPESKAIGEKRIIWGATRISRSSGTSETRGSSTSGMCPRRTSDFI